MREHLLHYIEKEGMEVTEEAIEEMIKAVESYTICLTKKSLSFQRHALDPIPDTIDFIRNPFNVEICTHSGRIIREIREETRNMFFEVLT